MCWTRTTLISPARFVELSAQPPLPSIRGVFPCLTDPPEVHARHALHPSVGMLRAKHRRRNEGVEIGDFCRRGGVADLPSRIVIFCRTGGGPLVAELGARLSNVSIPSARSRTADPIPIPSIPPAAVASALPPPNGAILAKPCVKASNCRWSTLTPADRNAAAYSLPWSHAQSSVPSSCRDRRKGVRTVRYGRMESEV